MKRSLVLTRYPVLSGSHWFVTRYRAQPFSPGLGQPVAPAGTFTGRLTRRHAKARLGRSPKDKNVNFCNTTAAFTVSPEPGALSCRANLPGDSALYAISVRRLIALRSGFLRTLPRGSALAFG